MSDDESDSSLSLTEPSDDDDLDWIGGDEAAVEDEDDDGIVVAPDEKMQAPSIEFSQLVIEIPADERMMPDKLSLFEVTEILSIRTSEIAKHANCFVDTGDESDPRMQARAELAARMCPLTLERVVGRRYNPETKQIEVYCEMWDPNEMAFKLPPP
jgi:hypothetical protein